MTFGITSKHALLAALALSILVPAAYPQRPDPLAVFPKDRVTSTVDPVRTIPLPGHLRREARPELRSGVIEKTRVLNQMIMTLKRDPQQEAALAALAESQQDRSSPNYHKWLTNDTYAQHYTVSKHDIDQVTQWLRSSGFTVDSVSPTGWRITFSGTVSQVEAAFRTHIQSYKDPRTGELHFANDTEPAIPEAFSEVIGGVIGLHADN